MRRKRFVETCLMVATAVGGLALILLAAESVTLMMAGSALLLVAAGGGFLLAVSALWRNYTEPTTLVREDGPVLLTVEQKRVRLRRDAVRGLLGALIMPVIVVLIDTNPRHPLALKIIAGVLVGAATGPQLFSWFPPRRKINGVGR
jgi:hypothetical protein